MHGANAAWPRMHVSAETARLSRVVGHARRVALDVPGREAYIEVLTPAIFASHNESEKVADALRGTVLEGREGRLILGTGGLALLCLLGGVPWPTGGGVAKERLRAAAALARLPSPLNQLDLALARVQAPSLSPVYRILASVSKARAARHEALIRQRLHVRLDDVSCYCEAWASPRVWAALMRSGVSAVLPAAVELPPALIPLRFNFSLGRTRASRAELVDMCVGDVVRIPMWLGIDGTGSVAIAGLTVGIRCFGQGLERVFEVVSVASSESTDPSFSHALFALKASRPLPRTSAMNLNSPEHPDSPSTNAGAPVVEGPAASTSQHGNDLTGLLDSMPVTLSAEVGILRLTVANLRALAPGMLLEIEPHAIGEVVLRTEEGRHLAGGRLVDIDGHMGIQITQLGSV